MANVSIKDIEDIQKELGIELTDGQKRIVLDGFNRVVMDRGESWNEIVKDLINNLIGQ
jgi:hypothetical protein